MLCFHFLFLCNLKKYSQQRGNFLLSQGRKWHRKEVKWCFLWLLRLEVNIHAGSGDGRGGGNITVYSGCSALLTMLQCPHWTQTSRHTLIRSFSRNLIYKHLCHFPHNLKPSYLSKTGTEVQKLLAVAAKYLALKIFKSFSTRGKIFCLIQHIFGSSWIDHDLYFCIRNIKVFLPRVSSLHFAPLQSAVTAQNDVNWIPILWVNGHHSIVYSIRRGFDEKLHFPL